MLIKGTVIFFLLLIGYKLYVRRRIIWENMNFYADVMNNYLDFKLEQKKGDKNDSERDIKHNKKK